MARLRPRLAHPPLGLLWPGTRMNKSNITNRLLWVIAGCLLVNTVVFALPAAHKSIKNEILWMESERQRKIAEEKEAERYTEALQMCTKQRVSLFNEAFASPGKEIPDNILNRIRVLPNEGRVPGNIQLYLAKHHYEKNPVNVQLPLTVSDCLATWPNFPIFGTTDPPVTRQKVELPESPPLNLKQSPLAESGGFGIPDLPSPLNTVE
jgi:hypothetical protein